MTDRRRVVLVAPLIAQPAAPELPCRNPDPDAHALASLMLDGYHGTIDYEGETLQDSVSEVIAYFEGKSGPPLLDCSFLALDAGTPVSACLVSLWHDEPLLRYAVTAAAAKGRGLATALIRRSMACLAAAGHPRLRLFVTVGNQPAEHIYRKLGFRPEDEPPAGGRE